MNAAHGFATGMDLFGGPDKATAFFNTRFIHNRTKTSMGEFGLWAFGQNSVGQLGVGDTLNRSSPVQVGSLRTWIRFSGNGYHTIALKY